jgi:hypothetical protein
VPWLRERAVQLPDACAHLRGLPVHPGIRDTATIATRQARVGVAGDMD